MNEFSIYKELESKKKRRYFRYFGLILLSFLFLMVVVSKDPKNSRAAGARITCINRGEVISYSTGGYIPAACENSEVSIVGEGIPTEIDMGTIKIWQDGVSSDFWETKRPGTECTDQADSYCDSKRHFKSLTLTNGAVLTHTAVLYGQDLSVRDLTVVSGIVLDNGRYVVSPTQGSERWKKVDIEVEGEINIDNTSKIDVSGKGYPGQTTERYHALYSGAARLESDIGPAGGLGMSSGYVNDMRGGGGSHAGRGGSPLRPGEGYWDNSGSYSYDQFHSDEVTTYLSFWNNTYGSGGGSASREQPSWNGSTGGAGGGLIRIKTGTLIMASGSIKANGTASPNCGGAGSYDLYCGGGGAGGSVNIQLTRTMADSGPFLFDVSGGAGNKSGDSGVYYAVGIDFAGTISGVLATISAKGGDADGVIHMIDGNPVVYNVAGGGGGGVILLRGPSEGNRVVVEKSIISVNNDGKTPENYGFRLGDTLTVMLDVSRIPATSANINVTDEVYQGARILGGNYYCKPDADSIEWGDIPPANQINANINNNKSLFWRWNNSGLATRHTFKYKCTINYQQ